MGTVHQGVSTVAARYVGNDLRHDGSDAGAGLRDDAPRQDRDDLCRRQAEHPISFAGASLGQQLSALLQLLLGQSAGTLIVDQPEDDLDNKVLI